MRPLIRLFATALATLALTACGSSGSYYNSQPPYGDVSYGEVSLQEVVVAGAQRTGPAAPAVPSDRKLVRTASLALSTSDGDAIPRMMAEADTMLARLGGFAVVATERARTYRVPSESLDAALTSLESIGQPKSNVEHREVRVVDVTAQFTDLEADLANQRALLARLREIAAQATTVSELLEAERELARVTGRIDALERQLRPLEDRVRLATLTFSVRERARPGPFGWVVVNVAKAVGWLFVWN